MALLKTIRSCAAIATALFLLSAATTVTAAGDGGGGGIIRITEYTDQLHFNLDTVPVFVRTTTDEDGNQVADIDLSVWWDALPPSSGLIDNFTVQICYDPTQVEFDQAGSSVNGDNWHGTLGFQYAACEGGNNTKLELDFQYEEGVTHVDEAQTTPTVYATLRFRRKCQVGNSVNDLDLVSLSCYMRFVNDHTDYKSTSLDLGGVALRDDYAASFVASDYHSDCSLLGEDIELPVSATTNFCSRSIRHRITYNSTYLTFNTATLSSADLAWDGAIQQIDANTIELKVKPAVASDSIAELNNTELYRLHFTVTSTIPWNGPYPAATVSFVPSECAIDVNYEGGTCTDIVPNVSYDGGAVWSDYHLATLHLIPDPADPLLANETDRATMIVAMSSNFQAGGAEHGIQFVVNTGDFLSQAGGEATLNQDVLFQTGTNSGPGGSNDEVWAYQDNTGTLPCLVEDTVDLIKFNVEPAGDFYDAPSYTERTVPLQFQDYSAQEDLHTHIREAVTGTIYNTDLGHVQYVTAGPEVPVVEFSLTSHTTDGSRVGSHLRIRNNFPLNSVEVTVGATGLMGLVCVMPATSGGSATDNGDGTWTLVVNDAGALAPGGDEYKELADCYYEPLNCTAECEQQSGTATVEAANLDYTGSYHYKEFTENGTVSANCCGIYGPVPCNSNPFGQKAETGSGNGLLPDKFAMHQNYPNPFNPTTMISYDVPTTSHVRLAIYNVLGQLVDVLVDQSMSPGRYEVEWDASRLASGVYLYRMEADNFVETKKMLLMK